MPIVYRALPHRWASSEIGYEGRLEEILQSWHGTPWRDGMQTKGAGVDCIRFVFAVLAELEGREPDEIPKFSHQISFHQPEWAFRKVIEMRRAYPEFQRVRRYDEIEPADVLVTKSAGGGPGHMLIAGGRRNTLWQAGTHGVRQGGLALVEGCQQLCYHYRSKRRERWLSN